MMEFVDQVAIKFLHLYSFANGMMEPIGFMDSKFFMINDNGIEKEIKFDIPINSKKLSLMLNMSANFVKF